jgi:hypothetical protein
MVRESIREPKVIRISVDLPNVLEESSFSYVGQKVELGIAATSSRVAKFLSRCENALVVPQIQT